MLTRDFETQLLYIVLILSCIFFLHSIAQCFNDDDDVEILPNELRINIKKHKGRKTFQYSYSWWRYWSHAIICCDIQYICFVLFCLNHLQLIRILRALPVNRSIFNLTRIISIFLGNSQQIRIFQQFSFAVCTKEGKQKQQKRNFQDRSPQM